MQHDSSAKGFCTYTFRFYDNPKDANPSLVPHNGSGLFSSSPICALIPPSSFNLTFKLIHETVPILFELLSSADNFPREIMARILNIMMNKAMAPFDVKSIPTECITPLPDVEDSLSFFPSLPKVRKRAISQRMWKSKTQNSTVVTRH